jgi:hypothetical protein
MKEDLIVTNPTAYYQGKYIDYLREQVEKSWFSTPKVSGCTSSFDCPPGHECIGGNCVPADCADGCVESKPYEPTEDEIGNYKSDVLLSYEERKQRLIEEHNKQEENKYPFGIWGPSGGIRSTLRKGAVIYAGTSGNIEPVSISKKYFESIKVMPGQLVVPPLEPSDMYTFKVEVDD